MERLLEKRGTLSRAKTILLTRNQDPEIELLPPVQMRVCSAVIGDHGLRRVWPIAYPSRFLNFQLITRSVLQIYPINWVLMTLNVVEI